MVLFGIIEDGQDLYYVQTIYCALLYIVCDQYPYGHLQIDISVLRYVYLSCRLFLEITQDLR